MNHSIASTAILAGFAVLAVASAYAAIPTVPSTVTPETANGHMVVWNGTNFDMSVIQENGGTVGVGTAPSNEKLIVGGDQRITGVLKVDRVCAWDGSNCFSGQIISDIKTRVATLEAASSSSTSSSSTSSSSSSSTSSSSSSSSSSSGGGTSASSYRVEIIDFAPGSGAYASATCPAGGRMIGCTMSSTGPNSLVYMNAARECLAQASDTSDRGIATCLFDPTFLYRQVHKMTDCEALGGTVMQGAAVGEQFCHLQSPSCPSGWSQYRSWSKTINSPDPSYSILTTNGAVLSVPACDGIPTSLSSQRNWQLTNWQLCTPASSHSFSDQAVESCYGGIIQGNYYRGVWPFGGYSSVSVSDTCYAGRTEIGCF